MIYIIVTTCLMNCNDLREYQYRNCISKLIELTKNIKDLKIIIVENNGKRATFLDNFAVDVLYTLNNGITTKNKGNKELRDVLECISNYNMQDDDFIVKMTGKYFLNNDSPFIKCLENINYECIVRFGSYLNPVNYQMNDCITGLIGMKSKFVKQIELPDENVCVEWNWAKATYLIEQSKIKIMDCLGINICPADCPYFLV